MDGDAPAHLGGCRLAARAVGWSVPLEGHGPRRRRDDLLEGLEARVGRKLAPPTVYRALDFLLEQGFIHRIASSSKYLTCDHPGEAHESIYFMCSNCGTAREIEDTRIAKLLSEDASGVGFSPQRHVVEVQGVCKDCGTA